MAVHPYSIGPIEPVTDKIDSSFPQVFVEAFLRSRLALNIKFSLSVALWTQIATTFAKAESPFFRHIAPAPIAATLDLSQMPKWGHVT